MQKLDSYASGEDYVEMTLYDLHSPTLYAYIYRRIAQPQDAEDVLLETFAIALKYDNLVHLTAQQQIAWLQSVARRKIIDRYRRNARVVLLPLDQALEALDDALTPEEQALRSETYKQLYAALAQLSSVQQQLICLRYGEGRRFAEIATILHKSEGTVRKMLARILNQLRALYARQ